MFFKTEPNVETTPKSKVEFYMQQIAESIGVDRLKRPMLGMAEMVEWVEAEMSLEELAKIVGEHLDHDISGLQIKCEPKPIEKCGGGG